MPPAIPNAIANGQVTDATKVMQNFQAVADYFSVTKVPVTELQQPYHEVTIPFLVTALVGGTGRTLRAKVPVGLTYIPKQVTLCFEADVAGAPVVSLDVLDTGVTILPAPLTADTPGTLTFTSTFSDSSIASGAVITLTLSCGGGTTAGDVAAILTCKAQHLA